MIDLERYYPSKVFVGVWDGIDELIINNQLFSVVDVLKELKQEHDDDDPVIERWEDAENFFVESNDEEQVIIKEIMNEERYEVFRNHAPDKGVWADPHLIACAESRDGFVITNETLNRQPERKIPFVCVDRDVKYMSMLELMQYLDWTF